MAKTKTTKTAGTKPADDELSPPYLAPRVTDTRPRFDEILVPALGGAVRIRRMEPEQLFKQEELFERAEVDPKRLAIAKKGDKEQLCRLIQRCLVPIDHHRLLCPGGKGLLRLLTLPDDTIISLAQQVVTFQEL